MALALFIIAAGLCAAHLVVLGRIFSGKQPRVVIGPKTQIILLVDLFIIMVVGSQLAEHTHSAMVSFINWTAFVVYTLFLTIRLPLLFKKEYRPMVAELAGLALMQVVMFITYLTAYLAS